MWRVDVANETLIGDIDWLRVIGMVVCIIFVVAAIPYIYTYMITNRASVVD